MSEEIESIPWMETRKFLARFGSQWLAETGLTSDKTRAKAFTLKELNSTYINLTECTIHPAREQSEDITHLIKSLKFTASFSKEDVLTICDAYRYGVGSCKNIEIEKVLCSLYYQIKEELEGCE